MPPSVLGPTRAFIRMLPYLGINYALPNLFARTLFGGVVVCSFLINPTTGMSTLSDVANAITVSSVISGTQDIVKGVREWGILKTGWGLFKVAGGGYVLYRQFSPQ
jgi:hypothetical protein